MSAIRTPKPSFFLHCVATLGALVLSAVPAHAEPDTEHMFGFTEGTDIGTAHQPEGELETIGAFGRAGGSYNAETAFASLKYPLTDSFRLTPWVALSRFDISGVTGMDDRNEIGVSGAGLEIRWRALDREKAPVGMTFVADTGVGFMDETTGARSDIWGVRLIAAVDRALVPERLFAALNVTYDFGQVRDHATDLTTDSSFLTLGAAASTRLSSWFYAGAEARYRRSYDALAFGNLTGQAVYVGPVFYMTMGEGVSLSGAWNIQAWGRATGEQSMLDLTNFDRHLVKLRLSVDL